MLAMQAGEWNIYSSQNRTSSPQSPFQCSLTLRLPPQEINLLRSIQPGINERNKYVQWKYAIRSISHDNFFHLKSPLHSHFMQHLGSEVAASAPLATADLLSRTQCGASAAGAEESGGRAVVFAEVEVHIATCEKKKCVSHNSGTEYNHPPGKKERWEGKDTPSEFVAVRLDWLHKGLPSAGQRLLTLRTMLWVPVSAALLSYGFVFAVTRKQRPQPGPAPAPGPTPKRFCEAAAL